MPPRRRIQISQESINQQLQQIHLLDSSSTTENLEQLGPIIKQIHESRQQDVYLRTLKQLIESKDAEIEQICGDNYQDFISSVSTLFTIKSYTTNLREKITTLDASVSEIGYSLVEKKKSLLQIKQTAANLDEAIDSLQASLRILDIIDKVGQLVKDGKYWSALRSLEDVQLHPSSSLSQTPLFQHILSSLPSLRKQIKDAVTASMKQWLLDMRNTSVQIGDLAMEVMEMRNRRWKVRRDKDIMLKTSKIGSAVETVSNEKNEYDILMNEKINVNFTPLYQCIHIYTALDALEELQKSYAADRKAQADLILASPMSASTLPTLLQEIVGFFIIESEVTRTTRYFRTWGQVEELWDTVIHSLTNSIEQLLSSETDSDALLRVKEQLLGFIMTLQTYSFEIHELQNLIITLFEKYTTLLEKKFSHHFDENVSRDDHLPMQADTGTFRQSVLETVWLARTEYDDLKKGSDPVTFPWSLSFYSCCQDATNRVSQQVRNFVQSFYQYIEGITDHHRDIDDLLGKSLDQLLVKHVSDNIASKLAGTTTLSQIAQIVMNLEHFVIACSELERSLTSLRSSQRGGVVRITASNAFSKTLSLANSRITSIITSKLDDFFELSEYDWTPSTKENAPSMYLYELINWLTTVVDSLQIKDIYKDDVYKGSVHYIAECLTEFIVGHNVTMLNENALSNVLVDVDFLENELKRVDRSHLVSAFAELRRMITIPLSDSVSNYLIPAIRKATYTHVKPKHLQLLLEKLSKYGASTRSTAERDKGERRRKEAELVGRLSVEDN